MSTKTLAVASLPPSQGKEPHNGIRAAALGGPVPALFAVDRLLGGEFVGDPRHLHPPDLDLEGDPIQLRPPDPDPPDLDLDLHLFGSPRLHPPDLNELLRSSSSPTATRPPRSRPLQSSALLSDRSVQFAALRASGTPPWPDLDPEEIELRPTTQLAEAQRSATAGESCLSVSVTANITAEVIRSIDHWILNSPLEASSSLSTTASATSATASPSADNNQIKILLLRPPTQLTSLAIASLLEQCPNRVVIVQLDDSTGEIRSDLNLASGNPHFRITVLLSLHRPIWSESTSAVSIFANKHPGDSTDGDAVNSRSINNCNVLSGMFTTASSAVEILDAWLQTPFKSPCPASGDSPWPDEIQQFFGNSASEIEIEIQEQIHRPPRFSYPHLRCGSSNGITIAMPAQGADHFSDGLPAHIPDINAVVHDCIQFFDSFREKHPPSSFIYSESLGGAIALLIHLRTGASAGSSASCSTASSSGVPRPAGPSGSPAQSSATPLASSSAPSSSPYSSFQFCFEDRRCTRISSLGPRFFPSLAHGFMKPHTMSCAGLVLGSTRDRASFTHV